MWRWTKQRLWSHSGEGEGRVFLKKLSSLIHGQLTPAFPNWPSFTPVLTVLRFLFLSPDLSFLSGIKQAIFFQYPSFTWPVQSSLWITYFSKETVQVKNQDVSQVLQIQHSKPHRSIKGRIKKKKSIVGETKFVQKRLRIWSCQKMSSWSSQVLEGTEECKCGINLFIQREPREGKWSRNSVSLLLFSAVMKEILWCFINTVLVSYPKPIALQGSMKKSAPFQPDTAHFSKSLQYCLFEQLWFSDNDEWESSDLNMP